jgi:long-chain acyl-CoA synthetase
MTQTPWVKSYPSPARWDAPLALGAVQDILDEAARRFGDRPAVEFMGKRATYAQLQSLANRAAKGFQQLGVGPGAHVGLYLPNTPHYLVAFFGVLKAGGTVVNYSPLDAAQVLAHKIEDSETSILVTLDVPTLLPQMEALLGTGRFDTLVVGGLADLQGFPDYADAGDRVAVAQEGRVAFQSLLANDGAYQPYEIGDPREAIAVLHSPTAT